MNLRRSVGPSHDETAAAGVFLANQLQSGRHVFEALDQHVLKQVAHARFDRALVLGLDLDEVGERAHLADLAVGVDQDQACRIGEPGAMRVDLFQRVQARGHRGQVVLARTHVARPPFVLDAGAGQLRLARRARDLRGVEAVGRAPQRVSRRLTLGLRLAELGGELARLELEPCPRRRWRARAETRRIRARR